MRCCVAFCRNTSSAVGKALDKNASISFHRLPTEDYLRDAWLRALGKQDTHLPDPPVVCSEHFLSDDIFITENGLKEPRVGAIPTTVQVCMTCLGTGGKQILISKYQLEEIYEKLTGYTMHDGGSLRQTVCVQCAQRLKNFNIFRDKSLRAHSLMMQLIEKHELITIKDIKLINRAKNGLKNNFVSTTLGNNHCDLHIVENDDKYKENDENHSVENVQTIAIKDEYNNSISVDEEQGDGLNDFSKNLSSATIKIKTELFGEALNGFDHFHSVIPGTSWPLDAQQGASIENISMNGNLDKHTLSAPVNNVPTIRSTDCANIESASKDLYYPTNQYPVITTKKEPYVSKTVRPNNVQRSSKSTLPVKRFTCDVCQKMYKRKTCFIKHIQKHAEPKSTKRAKPKPPKHAEPKRWSCQFCQHRFKIESNLVKHLKTHMDVKSFSCKLCAFKCAKKSYLYHHMKRHANLKPFACALCTYKCAENSNLVLHMRTHTGEKPFACTFCDYKCANSKNLKRHTKYHTGIKPFSCKLCMYKCVEKWKLKRHMKTHIAALVSNARTPPETVG